MDENAEVSAGATVPKRTRRDSLNDSDDEDLEGFIVKDAEYRKRQKKDGEDTSDNDEAEEEEEAPDDLPEDGPELAKVLVEEASKITSNLTSTVVGGRSLRDRSKIEKPKDSYWEKFGKKDYEKLMIKDQKKDFLDEIRAIKKDYEKNPTDYPTPPDDFRWPSVSMKDTIEAIEAALNYVSEALQIEYEDADDEDDAEDEDIDDDDEDEESDDEEDDDEEDDDDADDEEDDFDSDEDDE